MGALDARGNDRMLVAITQLDLVNMMFQAWNDAAGVITVHTTVYPGGTFVIPKVGEQWIVQKMGDTWFLDDKTSFQDPRALIPPEEGMTAYGGVGPTYLVGSKVDVLGDLYIKGVKYTASSGGGSTPAAALAWDQEMVLNACALASGYNDMAGGILINNSPNGVSLEAIVFRLGGDPSATIGGTGGITVTFYRGTPTAAETQNLGAFTGMTAHDAVLTLTTPIVIPHNNVLRAKVALGSATVSASCHVQWRGKRL